MGAAIAAGIVAIAGTATSAYMQNKAAKDANSALGGMQQLDLQTIPRPELVDWQSVLRNAIGLNTQNFGMTKDLANQVNQFQLGQFLRGANTIQPYFKQNQELIGRNAASFARGELPSDVQESIGRAAASRGFQRGFAGGLNAGGPGSALGSLNLRNLGLTSLQLSQAGTQMAMGANQSAANMVPALFDPTSMFISPMQAIGAQANNVGILNNWNALNTQIRNQEAGANTQLTNEMIQQQAQNDYARQVANAQAVQSATSQVSGLVGGMGGGGSMGGIFGGGASTAVPTFNTQQNSVAAGARQYGIF